jgi:hypothetical protein
MIMKIVKNNIIIKYLLITYLISWLLWIPSILRTIKKTYPEFNDEVQHPG